MKLNDSKAELKAKTWDGFALRNNIIWIERTAADILISKNFPVYLLSVPNSFPLMLAWGCTINKVQCLTLRKVG